MTKQWDIFKDNASGIVKGGAFGYNFHVGCRQMVLHNRILKSIHRVTVNQHVLPIPGYRVLQMQSRTSHKPAFSH